MILRYVDQEGKKGPGRSSKPPELFPIPDPREAAVSPSLLVPCLLPEGTVLQLTAPLTQGMVSRSS